MKYIIQTHRLNFSYGKSKKALTNLSINVPKGSIYGFLGPNGAGKSTTMRLLTGILPDEKNAISIFGSPFNQQVPEIFRRIGSIVESPHLYLHLTGYENLKYIAKIREANEDKIDSVLKTVHLFEDRNRRAKKYSLGMKQRLAIAMALLDEPELLLLDEPVNGLDPTGIVELRLLLKEINEKEGVTIFISSHLLSEVEKLCTHIGIIARGELKFEGTMEALNQQFKKTQVRIQLKNPEKLNQNLKEKYAIRFHNNSSMTEFNVQDKEEIPELIRDLSRNGLDIYQVKVIEGLEEQFISITH